MGVSSRTRRALPALAALWAVIQIPAMPGCIPEARAGAPLETYGRLPSLENVALSHDGSRLAFVRTSENARLLAVVDLTTRKVIGGSKVGETKLRHIAWADNDHLLITTSQTGMPWGLMGKDHEWCLLSVFEISTGKLRTYPESEANIRTLNVVAGPVMLRHLGRDTVLFIPGIYVESLTKLALRGRSRPECSLRRSRHSSDDRRYHG